MEILVFIFIFIVVFVIFFGPYKKFFKFISVDIDEEKGKTDKLVTVMDELLTRIKKLEDQNQEINKKLDKLLKDTGENN